MERSEAICGEVCAILCSRFLLTDIIALCARRIRDWKRGDACQEEDLLD